MKEMGYVVCVENFLNLNILWSQLSMRRLFNDFPFLSFAMSKNIQLCLKLRVIW